MGANLGYIRTSTDKQLNDRQINQLQQICDAVYVEDGMSAVGKCRPIYQQIIADLKQGDWFITNNTNEAIKRRFSRRAPALLLPFALAHQISAAKLHKFGKAFTKHQRRHLNAT